MHDRLFNPSQSHRLEDPARLTSMPPAELVTQLELGPGLVVADIGAGTGYFTLPIARAIQPDGRVFAVDLQPEMLALLDAKLRTPGAPANVTMVEADAARTSLSDSACDLVFVANVWHELPDQLSALLEFGRILKRNGRLAVLDWRTDVPARSKSAPRREEDPPGPPIEHRISAENLQSTLQDHDWSVSKSINIGQYNYLVMAKLLKSSA